MISQIHSFLMYPVVRVPGESLAAVAAISRPSTAALSLDFLVEVSRFRTVPSACNLPDSCPAFSAVS